MGNRSSHTVRLSIVRFNQFTDRWASLVITLSVLLVILATLIPFNFSIHFPSIKEVLKEFIKPSTTFYDFTANILLFVPFGVGLASHFRRYEQVRLDKFKIAVALSLGLSLTVEILQVFLPTRDPSLVDIFTNTIGGALGYWAFQQWRVRLIEQFLTLIQVIRPYLSLQRLLILLTVYTAVILIGSTALQKTGYLGNWDPNFPLIIGNERTGDRPWRGSVSDLYFGDRALSATEVAELLSGKQPPEILGNFLMAAYQLMGSGNYQDQTGNLPNLVWQGSPPPIEANTPALLSPDHWLTTETPATSLTQKIRKTSQFTMVTTIATDDTNQVGPSRAISLSADTGRRNFTLGQQNSHLVFRFRTPLSGENAASPQMLFPDILADKNPHRLVITYGGSVLKLYVDHAQQVFTRQWTPEIALFHLLIATDVTNANMQGLIEVTLKLLYYSLLFVPLGLILGILSLMLNHRFLNQPLLVYGTAVLPALLLEANRMIAGGNGLQPVNLLFSISITIATLLFVRTQLVPWFKAIQTDAPNQSLQTN